MLHTNFFTRLSFCFTLLVSLIFISGCKKQAYKPVGETNSSGVIDPSQPVLGHWSSAMIPYSKVVHIKSANGYLYFSTEPTNGVGLYRLNPDNTVSTILTTNLATNEINDLESFNGRLYFVGNISIQGGCNLGYLEGSSLTPVNVPLTPESYNTKEVHSLHLFDDHLYFSGSFETVLPYNLNYITTSNLERINSNFETGGAIVDGLSYCGPVTGNSTLYTFGRSVIASQPTESLLAKLNGTQWEGFNCFVPTTQRKILSVYDQNDTLFVSYCTNIHDIWTGWQSYDFKTKMIINGQEYPIQDFGGSDAIVQFKKVNNELFAFGSGITVNGKFTNILRLVNGHWKVDKIATFGIIDIEYHNGYYYAVTSGGSIFKTTW